jgi:two-component system response regulator HydG
VQRVGSIEPRQVDVRIVAATSRDLRAEVAAGRFRGDLYSRLNVAEVALPPLRHRREDIPYLTATFVQSFAQRFAKPLAGLTPGAERLLAEATWDGNVRQLRNVLERACILADGEFVTERELGGILRQQLPAFPAGGALPAGQPHRLVPLVEVEREHIVRTLEQVKGNKAVAAKLLGISRRAFYRQLERHGLHTSVPLLKRAQGAPIVRMGHAS